MTTPRKKPGQTPGTTQDPKAPAPEERQPYTGRRDPDTYARLSRPWPSKKAAHAAISAFFEEAHELRIKHGIADVTIIAAVRAADAGQEATFSIAHHSGDSRNQLPMVASTFRSLREQDREAWLEMAGLLSEPAVVVKVVQPAASSGDDPAKDAKEDDLDRVRAWLRDAQGHIRDAQKDGDAKAEEANRRDEQRLCLAAVAHGDDQYAGPARRRILDRIDTAETIARLVSHKDIRLLTVVDAARGAGEAGLWGAAANALGDLEDDLVLLGCAVWVNSKEVLGGWGLAEAPAKTDLKRCIRGQAEAQRDGSDAGDRHDSDWADRAGRAEENWRLAIRLHDGDEKARETVRLRLDLLSRYLMLRGGTNFLATCRSAVAEQRWGDLIVAIAELEEDFVADKTFRRVRDEDGEEKVEPTGKVSEGCIPTTIDPGGPLL